MMEKTSLYPEHIDLSAKMVPFCGYEMPINYPSGIKSECFAVRNNVGIFDVSHMGEFWVKGENSESFLQMMLTNDVSKLQIGEAQYTAMCYETGGIIDDLIIYKDNNGYLLVVNAANIEKNLKWLKDNLSNGVKIIDKSEKLSLIAIQGPNSRSVIESIIGEKQEQKFYTFKNTFFLNNKIMISRTGYTGELGFEIMADNVIIKNLWKKCIELGAAPCGLASRDILRMEMKYCLYGNDMDSNTTPLEAGLGWITSFDKGEFKGMESMIKRQKTEKNKILIAFEMMERGIPRQNYEIYIDNEVVGKVTSGTQSPILNRGIGMGYITSKKNKPNQKIEILIRDKKVNAQIIKPPFIKQTSLLD